MQILVCVLIMVCTLSLVQCAISIDIEWSTAINIAAMLFVYGFPYLLAIPAIWDVAQRNSAKNFLRHGGIEVQNLEAIEDVASLNYLAVQSISVLDERSDEKIEEYRRTIRGLRAAGVKVVLAAGIPEDSARKTALEIGILKPEHANICGAVISGQELRKIINGQETGIRYDITPEYLSVVYKASAEERAMLIDYLAKVHPGRASANSPTGFGSETFRTAPPVATVGVVGSGQNDLAMMSKAKISFCTFSQCDEIARNAADMVLKSDNIADVVNAVVRGRAFKDRLMQFLLLQLPSSLTQIAMVFLQVFLYDQILVTASFVFLTNLVYFPIAIVCLVREDPGVRRYEMIERWRSARYPGTKSITSYMRGELLKFSIFVVTLFQTGAIAGLYYYADSLFSLVHVNLTWQEHESEPLFVDQDWLNAHPDATGAEIFDLTTKGQMFLIMFQTFAYLQIFNVLNARRPSYKDLNPVQGISILTAACFVLLLGFQFSLVYIPKLCGYGSIDELTNLLCMAVGACSVLWFFACKVLLRFVIGIDDKQA